MTNPHTETLIQDRYTPEDFFILPKTGYLKELIFLMEDETGCSPPIL